ncbi:MAG: hypothetical protein COU35_02215 [Candidatus Magasanikbacteria bacterium CG10_big_fil_rev_8_21_14_0_10_47_10]|uniref:DNA polymerase III subunit delta n=1 Tax=Candidatus Magasanikbacteria bacterium CG10_big_fil_rev_8_21_14_0_10_47_10 TaxID=1974652 RepID=A0A2H0TQR3_9BACT|nr:MAG: hypothetical protein COU35_02215 [Candidatus Magasanikbacteria bacterium CG10_big_fil_rev_8_21_14_0_10_47_10]
MDDILGHEKIRVHLDSLARHDALSHAYCFVGPEQIGKKSVALDLAGTLLAIPVASLAIHPDMHFVKRGLNKKTGKTKKHIDIDQIREMIHSISRHPMYKGGYKIAIIDNAHLLSAAASNALLKTLEEPRGKTCIFLVTHDQSALLATIRSRVTDIFFSPVPAIQIQKMLVDRGFDPEQSTEMARVSLGKPGRALEWAGDMSIYDAYKENVHTFVSLFDKSFHEKRAAISEMFGDKTDHIAARQLIDARLQLWQLLARDIYLTQIGSSASAHYLDSPPRVSAGQLLHIQAEIEQARRYITKNVHPQLLIDHILLAIGT